VGPDSESLRPFQEILFSRFLPNKTVLYLFGEEGGPLTSGLSVTEGKTGLNGQPTAYVCEQFTCKNPVNTPEEFEKMLEMP